MPNPRLFGGQPPQAPAAPGSPGLAAGPQAPAAVPQAPMAPAGMDVDPGLVQFMQQNPHLDPMMAKQAYDYKKARSGPKMFAPQKPITIGEALTSDKFVK